MLWDSQVLTSEGLGGGGGGRFAWPALLKRRLLGLAPQSQPARCDSGCRGGFQRGFLSFPPLFFVGGVAPFGREFAVKVKVFFVGVGTLFRT